MLSEVKLIRDTARHGRRRATSIMAADSDSRLAVILHADVAGSTLLVQQDDQLAHARMRDTYERLASTADAAHVVVRDLEFRRS